MSDTLNSLESMNACIGNNAFNVWLGLKAVAIRDGQIELEVPWRDEIAGAPGRVHGGVLASALDAAGFLVLKLARGQDGGPTIDLRVDYHAPAVDLPLRLTGRVLRAGRTVSSVELEARDRHGALVASGRAVYLSTRRQPQAAAAAGKL